jgi:hypothetical protein
MTRASARLAWLSVVVAAGALPRCVGERHVSLLDPGADAGLDVLSADAGVGAAGGFWGDAARGGGIRPLGAGGLEAMRASACVAWTAQRQPEPAVLTFVVDVSGSMNRRDPSGDGTLTKWQVAQPALRDAVDALPPAMGLGLIHYPNMATPPSHVPLDSSACVNVNALIAPLPLGPLGSVARRVIDASLEGTVPNNEGGTPTHDAYLIALRELARTSVPGRKYVVLMTDGQPTFDKNCVGTGQADYPADKAAIIQEIAAARAGGVGTFMIGAPGSEQTTTVGQDARPWLSRAAEAGGTALAVCSHSGPTFCHFDMVVQRDFGVGLREALTEIAGRVVDCAFELPQPPLGEVLDRNRVNVVFTTHDGTAFLISRDDSATCDDGWRYSGDGKRIVLCAAACDFVQADVGGQLDLLFGCATYDVVH